MKFYGSKAVVAQFVDDLMNSSNVDWPSITITKLEKSEGYSVSIVTDTSSAGTAENLARIYSVALLSTSPPNTQDG